MSITQTIFLGAVGSIIASFIFLFTVLLLFKPKIKIAEIICKSDKQIKEDPTLFYFFKIINKSVFSTFDVRVELNIIEKYPTPPSGMMNKRTLPLELVWSYVSHIPEFRPKWCRKEAAHCMRFRTKVNLDDIMLNPFNSVQLQVTCKHGLTGLVKVFYQDFADVSLIKAGQFSYGTKVGYIE